MITKAMKITTATFDGACPEGYAYPDTAYGDDVRVSLEYTHIEEPTKSICVKIGDKLFPEDQIRFLIEELDKFKELCNHIK